MAEERGDLAGYKGHGEVVHRDYAVAELFLQTANLNGRVFELVRAQGLEVFAVLALVFDTGGAAVVNVGRLAEPVLFREREKRRELLAEFRGPNLV